MADRDHRPLRSAESRRRGLAASLAAALVACGTGSSEEIAAAPAPPPVAASGPYATYGLPGPWSREGASRRDFERETRACRRRSSAARNAPGVEDRSDAGYRAFLECMTERGWTRGALPAGTRQVSRAGSQPRART